MQSMELSSVPYIQLSSSPTINFSFVLLDWRIWFCFGFFFFLWYINTLTYAPDLLFWYSLRSLFDYLSHLLWFQPYISIIHIIYVCIYYTYICMVCPEHIQPYNMKNGGVYWRRYKIQETLYIGQWCLSPLQSRYLGTLHSSPNCHPLPHCIFLNLINSLKSLSFQRWL